MMICRSKDYIDTLLDIFRTEYEKSRKIDYIVTNYGKERKALGALLKLFKEKNPELTLPEMTDLIAKFFSACLAIQDKFIYENLSPSIIMSQINKIRMLLSGKFRKNNIEYTESEARSLSDKLANGSSLLEFAARRKGNNGRNSPT